MVNQLHLKELECQAFRSIYQDGLWDLYFGLIVICKSIFVYRLASGYSPLNIVLALSAMAVSYSLFWTGKKYVTLPRMGQVQFGAQRQKRKRTMMIVLSVVVMIQVVLVSFQLLAWANPEVGDRFRSLIPNRNVIDLIVASVRALIVGPSMILFALPIFLMIYLNHPIYPIIIGTLIALPGLVLFVRFLQKYPLRRMEKPRE